MTQHLSLPLILDPRHRSLTRGNIMVVLSVLVSIRLSDFPHNRPTLLLLLPTLFAMLGTVDTIRCMRRSWNFYHAGVILCIYMDLMALCMILFLLIYPYSNMLTSTS